jgi:hypothetical protein
MSVSGLLASSPNVPESITVLARGAIQTMFLQTIKLSGVAALLAAGVVGTAVLAQQGKDPSADPELKAAPLLKAARKQSTAAAQKADSLPRPAELARINAKIQEKLDQMIDADLPRDTDLGSFLKYIEQTTTDATFPGIPIYVDPLGLQEAQTSIDTKLPSVFQVATLRDILHVALRQLKLSYSVRDGFLMISSRTEIMEQRLDILEQKLDRVIAVLNRLENSGPGRGDLRGGVR